MRSAADVVLVFAVARQPLGLGEALQALGTTLSYNPRKLLVAHELKIFEPGGRPVLHTLRRLAERLVQVRHQRFRRSEITAAGSSQSNVTAFCTFSAYATSVSAITARVSEMLELEDQPPLGTRELASFGKGCPRPCAGTEHISSSSRAPVTAHLAVDRNE